MRGSEEVVFIPDDNLLLAKEYLGMLDELEKWDRQIWEKHSRVLEDVTHSIGGVGVGLMVYSSVARWARPLGYGLVAISLLFHLYALLAPQSKLREIETRLKRAA